MEETEESSMHLADKLMYAQLKLLGETSKKEDTTTEEIIRISHAMASIYDSFRFQ